MSPARNIKLWLTSSASLGASLSVDKKNWLLRMILFLNGKGRQLYQIAGAFTQAFAINAFHLKVFE